MKHTNVAILLIIMLFTSTCFGQTTVRVYGKEVGVESHFGVQLSGSIIEPAEMLADNYLSEEQSYAVGISMVSTPFGQSNINLKTISLVYSRDSFQLTKKVTNAYDLDSSPIATIHGIQVRTHEDVPLIWTNSFGLFLFMGNTTGSCRFKLDDSVFNTLGESTLTELKHENDMTQLCNGNIIGVHVTGLKHISLEASYDQMSVERTWMFGHTIISTMAYGIAREAIPEIASWVLPDNITSSMPFNIFALLIKSGISYYLYEWDYDHHNWPFNGDDPPLHYNRISMTMNVYF